MIDERMQEKASLHVLGALTPAEAYEFKQAMQSDPELKQFVSELTPITGALAGALPAVEPPPQLRAKILAGVGEKQKIISLPERKVGLFAWLPWAFAVVLGVICLGLFAQDSRLRGTVYAQTIMIRNLNHELDQLALTLQSATNNLQQTVLALQETNRLANLRIAVLNSLVADAPTAVAVTLWDESKQQGVFVVQNLKPLSADKDYQLWVLDNGTTPVDAGVFHVDENGSVRITFKAKSPIKVAGKFAVTKEAKGGVASPTLKDMVLAGG